jgi:alanine racemase
MNDATARWLDGPTSWLELSRANLLHNLAGVQALVGGAQIMAVLKANAYGAGAVGMARVLAGAGVDVFGVATVAEGVELRQGGIAGTIVCLAYFTRQEVPAIFEYDLTPSVFTLPAARLLDERAQALRRVRPVWVKVDTGLGRLGIPFDAAGAFLREIGARSDSDAGLRVAGIFSTLTENPDRDPIQADRLLAVRQAWWELARSHGAASHSETGQSRVLFSLASSHGIVALPESYLDIVRPGILLHGREPSDRSRMEMRLVERADLRPIATWKARVADARTVATGEQIGYGWRSAVTIPTRVATLAVGWADGYPPAMANGGVVLVQGCPCPVLAVSANSTIMDLSNAPGADTNDEVVLMGRHGCAEITAAEMARQTGAGVYRLLTAIPVAVPRIWV